MGDSPISAGQYDHVKRNLFLSSEGVHPDTRFSQIALARRYLTVGQLEEGIEEQRRRGEEGRLGHVLMERGLLTEEQLREILDLQSRGALRCSRCDRSYDVSGHPDGVSVRCLKCGDQLTSTTGDRGETSSTPYRLEEDTAEEARLKLGKYRLIREIARGGMGIVFEAEDPELKRPVALKILREGDAEPEVVSRLHREAAIAAQLQHPGIVGIHEVGMVRDPSGRPTHFIAMDYVEGRTLGDLFGEGKTPRRELVRMLEDVARAVAFAHSKKVVHRDLKPANVLVDREGRVVLTDFGLARAERFGTRLTHTNAVLGTPAYMAPEQVDGKAKELGPKADVYALGVMLFEILTGRLPFDARTPGRLYEQILNEEPRRPSQVTPGVEWELEVICLRAMEKNPEHRYATATTLADDLRRFLNGEPIQARRVSTWRRVVKKALRNKAMTALAVGMAVVVVSAAAVVGTREWRNRKRLAEEQMLRARREASLKRLATLWAGILEANREVRLGRVAPEAGWRELEERIRAVDGYIREWPNDPVGYYVRARGKMYLGDLEGAEKDALAAVERRADFRPGWALVGMIKIRLCGSQSICGFEEIPSLHRRIKQWVQEAIGAFERGWDPGKEKQEAERWGLAWTREEQVTTTIARAQELRYRGNPNGAGDLLQEAFETVRSEEIANALGNLFKEPERREGHQDTALRLAPGYAEAWLDRGSARKDRGNIAGAIADFTQAITLRRNFADAYLSRGALYEKQKEFRAAIADYDRVIELRPWSALAYANRGGCKGDCGDPRGALADFDMALQRNDDHPEALYNRGRVKAALEDRVGAIRDFDRAIEVRPENVAAYIDRGLSKASLGNFPGAVLDFDRALHLDPKNARAYGGRALAKAGGGDHQGAISDYDREIELRKDDARAYMSRGRSKAALRDQAGAISDFDRALQIDPGLSDAIYNRAQAKADLGNPSEAIRDYDLYLSQRPKHAEAYYNRANQKSLLRDSLGAIGDFDRAIELDRNFAMAYVGRGNEKLRLEHLEGALADYDRAIATEKEVPEAYCNRGAVKARKRDLVGAIADFDHALRLRKEYPDAYWNRGLARSEAGQYAGAVDDFEESLRLHPRNWPGRRMCEERLRFAREKLNRP